MGKRIFLLISLLYFYTSLYSASVPALDQTGNLLVNGNFEEGTTAWVTTTSNSPAGGTSAFTVWDQWLNTPPSVTTQQDSSLVIDGSYSGHIIGNAYDGILQYNMLPAGTYTLSAWIYPLAGSAYISAAFAPIFDGNNDKSSATTGLNTWQFLETTYNAPNAYGGPFIYCASNNSDFLVDGVWLNSGSVTLSPYALQNGSVNPNYSYSAVSPTPIPATVWILGSSLLGLIGIRKRVISRAL